MHHSRKLWSLGAPRSRRATCSIQSDFFQSLKKNSACHQFGFINQSVKDVTKIAGCRVREGKKTADGNISQLAEAKLPSVSVYELGNSGCA